ncbi:MAG: DUF4091 domain-containing protein [Candidatus Lokiarchaeota archaeon]|nr:DUF4091 domain-containing protein [Candidatus Lokiarchaeota archaeon]
MGLNGNYKKVILLNSAFFIGLCYAILMFFGMWVFHPEEILYNPENNNVKYVIFVLAIFILISFIIGFLQNQNLEKHKLFFLTIGMTGIITTFIILIIFSSFVSKNWEWWITQSGWFMRLKGGAVGSFSGITFLNATIRLIYVNRLWIHSDQKKRNNWFMLLFCSFFGHLAVLNSLFNPYGLLSLFIYFLVLFSISFIISMTLHVKFESKMRTNEIKNLRSAEVSLEEGEASIIENGGQEHSQKTKTLFHIFLQNPHNKAMLLVFLAQIGVLFIVVGNEIRSSETYLIVLPVLLGLGIIAAWSIATKKKRSRIWSAPEEIDSEHIFKSFFKSPIPIIKEQIGIFITAVFELLRTLTPFIGIFSVWYGARLLFQLPDFQVKISIAAIFGVILHSMLEKKQKKHSQYIFYFILFGLSILLIFFLNQDITTNMYSFYGMDYDLIFPFHVLLSNWHAGVIGVATGYIISFEIRRYLMKYTDKSNLNSKVNLLSLLFFFFGAVIVLFGVSDLPGGDVSGGLSIVGYNDDPFVPDPFLQQHYLLSFILISVSMVLVLIFDLVLPKIRETRFISNLTQFNEWHPLLKRGSKLRTGKISRKEVFGLVLVIALIVPVTSFLVVPKIKEGFSLQLLTSNSAVDVYGAPSNIRIGSHQYIIGKNRLKTNESGIYNISMARNEYESMQLVLKTKRRSLNGFRYSISEFNNTHDNSVIQAGNISIKYLENLYFETMPERLKDFSYVHLIEKRNHIIYITAYTPYNCNPGSYLGNINFTYGDSESFLVKLSLDVWNFTIPKQRHMRSNFGPMTENQEKIDTFLNHRINTYGIPIHWTYYYDVFNTEQKYTAFYNISNQEWSFNWTWWDQRTELMLNNGANGFSINNPYGMPRNPEWLEDDLSTISEWGNVTKKFYEGVQTHLEYKRDIEGKDWFEYAYIYFIDEFSMFVPDGFTREEYWDALEIFLELLNNSAPDLKIMTTTPPSSELTQLKPYIDIYCPVTSDYNETEWIAVLNDGVEMWMYPCVGPRAPWPNSHFYNRLYEIRVLYWQVWHYNIHGFLYWSTTPYYHGKYGPGFNGWGDAWYLYEDEYGNVDETIRWDNWRDAAEDYEYIWLMNTTIEALGESEEDKALLQSTISSIVADQYEYCDSGSGLIDARDLIGEWISNKISDGSVELLTLSEAEWNPP